MMSGVGVFKRYDLPCMGASFYREGRGTPSACVYDEALSSRYVNRDRSYAGKQVLLPSPQPTIPAILIPPHAWSRLHAFFNYSPSWSLPSSYHRVRRVGPLWPLLRADRIIR